MTNTNDEMSVGSGGGGGGGQEGVSMDLMMMMPAATTTIGASCEHDYDEAQEASMQDDYYEGGGGDDDAKEGIPMHEFAEESNNDYEQSERELVIAVGNAAQAYRQQQRLRSSPPKEPDTEIATTTTFSEDDGGSITTAAPTSDNMNDDDSRDDNDPGNSTMNAEPREENETCTVSNPTTMVVAPSTTSAVGVDDDEVGGGGAYVGKGCEEKVGSYKTSSSATQSQSEQFIQQPKEELAKNALISTLSLFLVKTWNWLHTLFVTIIFLNLQLLVVRLRQRRQRRHQLCGESVVIGEARSVEVEGPTEEEGKEESESGNVIDSEQQHNSSEANEEEKSTKLDDKMSPNTCSIQNTQEGVEKAEEAIIATEVQTEKAGVTEIVITPPEEVTDPAPEAQVEEEISPVEMASEEKTPIRIILPAEDDQSDDSEDNVDSRRDSVDSCVSSEGSGNLGDTEDGSGEKSEENSNDGDSNSDVVSNTGEESAKEVAQKIIFQVEAMFSDDSLSKDGFLLKHVRRRSDGFVSLKLVAGLRKVKQISGDFPMVLDALKDSTKLEVNPEGTKVRRVEPLTPFLKAVPIKSKDKDPKQGKDKENGSSNDENQQPNKSGSAGTDNGRKQAGNQQNRRHSAHVQNNANNTNNGNQSRRNSSVHSNNNRKSSNTSTGSSNNSSRHNSFSKAPGNGSQHPADLFRNVYTSVMGAYSSSGEDNQSPQVGRRRGGSLPITALQQRSSGSHLSPNSSPPNAFVMIGPNGGARPKSNSYCEGACPSTMSPWLQRRKASASSRLSTGELTFNGVVRQPRGPDGTKGFASGYRAMIIQERLDQSNSAVSA